jgi:ubiquinone/menaquinone biosynthesis C-methylase UbiE
MDYESGREEWSRLSRVADFRGARVLEIGCGDGRIARRWGPVAALAVGIDPNSAVLRDAPLLAARGTSLALPFAKHRFDIALLGWSL